MLTPVVCRLGRVLEIPCIEFVGNQARRLGPSRSRRGLFGSGRLRSPQNPHLAVLAFNRWTVCGRWMVAKHVTVHVQFNRQTPDIDPSEPGKLPKDWPMFSAICSSPQKRPPPHFHPCGGQHQLDQATSSCGPHHTPILTSTSQLPHLVPTHSKFYRSDQQSRVDVAYQDGGPPNGEAEAPQPRRRTGYQLPTSRL